MVSVVNANKCLRVVGLLGSLSVKDYIYCSWKNCKRSGLLCRLVFPCHPLLVVSSSPQREIALPVRPRLSRGNEKSPQMLGVPVYLDTRAIVLTCPLCYESADVFCDVAGSVREVLVLVVNMSSMFQFASFCVFFLTESYFLS